jgi:hypothetical protein
MQSATAIPKATMRGAGSFVQMPTRGIVVVPARRPVAFNLTDYTKATQRRRHDAVVPAGAPQQRMMRRR